ncbi:MAG: ATP-binding protein [Ilumatobacteraceae bacterium]
MAAETFTATLSASPASIGRARRGLQQRLHEWGCGNAADIALVFSELVTNAIVHTGSAPSVQVTHGEGVVRIDVHDHAQSVPMLRDADAAPGGYGMHIVDQICDSWGWEQNPTGKTVWSVVRCSRPISGEAADGAARS